MITPNMSLVLPVPSTTLGPLWANQLNQALELVDDHDHSSGKGVRVTPAGLNINQDLDIKNNNLLNVRSLRLFNNGATLLTPQDIRSLYVVNGNLFYNNAGGSPVQITNGSSVASSAAGPAVGYAREFINSTPVTILSANTNSFFEVNVGSAASITLPLANAVSAGRFYYIKDISGAASSNNITVSRAGADTIDGNTSVVINDDRGAILLVSDGVGAWSLFRLNPTIQDDSVTASKISINAITTAKIADSQVTAPKLATTSAERDWVLGRYSELTAGAVGTVALVAVNPGNLSGVIVNYGGTIAGSLLQPSSGQGIVSGSTLSGTWRCLGYKPANSAAAFLAVRIV